MNIVGDLYHLLQGCMPVNYSFQFITDLFQLMFSVLLVVIFAGVHSDY